MNQGLIPSRYAKALYKLAVERGADHRIYEMMRTMAAEFAANPDLQKVMANPFVATADKTALLITAAGQPKEDTLLADFIKLLVRNNRIDLARLIAEAYLKVYRHERRISIVEVTSAAALDQNEERRLRHIIEARLNGGSMEFSTKVDPAIIGGFVVKIDNERLDASVANELEQLRLKLISKKD